MLKTGRRHAFTLIELLVVISIVGILVSIILAVGANTIESGRARQTADAVRTVDQAIATYISDAGQAPPAFVLTFAPGRPQTGSFVRADFAAYPMADAVDLTDSTPANRTVINSMGLFIRAAESIGLEDLFATVPAQLLTRWDGDADLVETGGTPPAGDGRQPELRTILDGWGRPLRFVHPAWDGIVTEQDNRGRRRPTGRFGDGVNPIAENPNPNPSDYSYWLPSGRAPEGFNPATPADFPIRTLRRDRLTRADRDAWTDPAAPIGDGDGGYTVGGVPYAYSSGPDGDPSTIEDNVYSKVPRFASE
jgi:prepilin-type N-terminal cleavage/methylation domain-containing protein